MRIINQLFVAMFLIIIVFSGTAHARKPAVEPGMIIDYQMPPNTSGQTFDFSKQALDESFTPVPASQAGAPVALYLLLALLPIAVWFVVYRSIDSKQSIARRKGLKKVETDNVHYLKDHKKEEKEDQYKKVS